MMRSSLWRWLPLVAVLALPNLVFPATDDGDSSTTYPALNNSWSYCFEYTWLGPDYDQTFGYNGTCEDYKDDFRLGDKIPCSPPLVISYDGTIPDVNYLWKNHMANVLCRRSEGQACVTYTYWLHGLMQNQTHMCARVKTENRYVVTKKECYKQKNDGYDVELCLCVGDSGIDNMPCNT